jgi:DNA-nicking Smr family endonuclease
MTGRNPFEPLDGPVDDRLDLHGMSASEAVAAAKAFVLRSRRRAPGALLHIITGRGRGSRSQPVLKPKVRSLLKSGELPVTEWGEDLDGGGFLLRLER